ncbi:MAG: Cna B-type domain-containing protein, partial [Eggerthellaceae bacterium]|nr:Cna B-type domain-containing protein [Eggerthellaceae bacterium]
IFPFGAMASSSFNLHSGTADTMLYVPHKLFIPEGYPALTIRGERWHDEIFYVRDDGQKEGIRTHVFEVKYDGDRPTTSLQVKKTWQGFDGEDIPSFIDVALVDADGNEVAKTRIVKESEWVSRFENLPTYKDGEKIDYSTYSVTEITAFDNVSTSINYSAEDGFTITNAKINTPPADTPHEPQDPKTPETPKAPEKPVKEIPKTADATSVSTIFSMLFLSLACMGLARYARRCEC